MGQTQGRELPYDIGEAFSCLSSKTIWSVHAGKKKVTGEPVTVFVFDFTDKSPEEVKSAQSAHLRLKTLRHPNILKYIDGIEFPTSIYVVTEEALPLETYITTKPGSSEFSIGWGLHQVTKSVSFLNNDCGLVHRNVCLSSVFVDEAGEWKLAGVEFMHSHGDTSMPPKTLPSLHKYDPPEVGKSGAAARHSEKWSADVWGLGCLIWEAFNGPLPQTSSLRNTSKLPKLLVPYYCEMVSANPKSRPNPSVLLDKLRQHGGFLATNQISIALRIEELQIMEPTQRNEFFNELNKNIDSFPKSFAKHKILPQLINAFEFGGAGSAVLAPLFRLGGLLEGEQYQKKIVPCVVKLFSSTDRATRLNLLQQLQHFIDHLLPATVNDQIFPHIANGFSDTVPAMREMTVKATVLIAPKLSSSTLNGPLLKCLAKCQLDEQPSIRTNTNVCLGRIAGYLSPSTRQKVLVTAFLRALKDPFPPARIAAIGSMGATQAFFSTGDIASRVLPALCTVTVDKEKSVRDQAFQTIKLFLSKLERLSEDPQAAAEQEKVEAAAKSWTGWAVSSLTSKFYRTPQSQGAPSNTGADTKGTMEERKEEGKAVVAPSSPPATTPSSVTGGTGVEKSHTVQESPSPANWDDGWEDFNSGGQSSSWEEPGDVAATKDEDSDMEGWEDDGWGMFDAPQKNSTQPSPPPHQEKPPPPSSGADFFDSFSTTASSHSKKTKPTRDPFDDFGFSSSSSSTARNERTPPPLTSALLFSSKSSKSADSRDDGSGGGGGGGGDGWGDWSEDFDVQPSTNIKASGKGQSDQGRSAKTSRTEPQVEANKSSSGGWGDDSWGTFDDDTLPVKSGGGGEGEGLSKQELLQKKREERRLKQQAAREKRAAGVKSGGLGAVKKD